MDKVELEHQILCVLDTEDWMTAKQVYSEVCETFGSRPTRSAVKNRLDSLVRFKEAESKMETSGYKEVFYKKVTA